MPATVPCSGIGKLRRQRGAVYLTVLFLVAMIGVGLAATGAHWQFERRRHQEDELIYLGEQYRKAIGLYYMSSPGTLKRYPRSLDELLLDQRFIYARRYLRKRYPDPVSGQDWGMVRAPDGGVMGVYSPSDLKPIKERHSDGAARYRDWLFVYQPNEMSAGATMTHNGFP